MFSCSTMCTSSAQYCGPGPTSLWLFCWDPCSNVSLSTRREVISWLMPKMVFYMPTVSAVTTTAGYFLALRLGFISLHPPVVYWIFAVLVIVTAMFIQGLGILLPTNLRIYFE